MNSPEGSKEYGMEYVLSILFFVFLPFLLGISFTLVVILCIINKIKWFGVLFCFVFCKPFQLYVQEKREKRTKKRAREEGLLYGHRSGDRIFILAFRRRGRSKRAFG